MLETHNEPSPLTGAADGGQEATRMRLIQAALEQFALRGIEAVSLRAITAAAGAANQSAVHYHFRNKLGLVAAVLEDVNEQLRPLQEEALAELAKMDASGTLSVRAIVGIAFAPYVLLFQQSLEGRLAIRFLSRLTWQAGDQGQSLLVQSVRPYFEQVENLLRGVLPRKAPEALGFHVYLAVNNLIHGLADISLLGRDSSFGVDRLYREHPQRLLDYFCDYVAAGLSVDS